MGEIALDEFDPCLEPELAQKVAKQDMCFAVHAPRPVRSAAAGVRSGPEK